MKFHFQHFTREREKLVKVSKFSHKFPSNFPPSNRIIDTPAVDLTLNFPFPTPARLPSLSIENVYFARLLLFLIAMSTFSVYNKQKRRQRIDCLLKSISEWDRAHNNFSLFSSLLSISHISQADSSCAQPLSSVDFILHTAELNNLGNFHFFLD